MKKEIYIKEAESNLSWVKNLKKEGRFTYNLKTHYLSKLDGITEIAIKDEDLNVDDYNEVLEKYRDIQAKMWTIISDDEKELEI